ALLVGDAQRNVGQQLLQRLGGIVGDGADVAAVQVQHRQRLEHVADLGLAKSQTQRGVPLDASLALEVADPVFVKDHSTDWQVHGYARWKKEKVRSTRGDLSPLSYCRRATTVLLPFPGALSWFVGPAACWSHSRSDQQAAGPTVDCRPLWSLFP